MPIVQMAVTRSTTSPTDWWPVPEEGEGAGRAGGRAVDVGAIRLALTAAIVPYEPQAKGNWGQTRFR